MLNIYTNFNADKSILAGGAALSAGIGHGIESLGESIGKALEKRKQRGQLATSLRKTLSVAYPEKKDQFATMGLEDLQGTLEGEAVRSAQAKEERARRLDDALMEQRALQAQSIREALANAQQEPAFLSRMGELMQPRMEGPGAGEEGPANQVPGLSPAAALGAASRDTGYRPDLRGAIDDLIRNGGAAGSGGPLAFEEDPVTGQRFARQGRSVLPSGTNPDKLPKEGEEIRDADGNLLGHNVPTGGGKFAFRPLKASATGDLLPVLDPVTKQPVPGYGMDATGKVHDFRNIMQKAGFGEPAQPGASDAGRRKVGGKLRFNIKTGKLEPVE